MRLDYHLVHHCDDVLIVLCLFTDVLPSLNECAELRNAKHFSLSVIELLLECLRKFLRKGLLRGLETFFQCILLFLQVSKKRRKIHIQLYIGGFVQLYIGGFVQLYIGGLDPNSNYPIYNWTPNSNYQTINEFQH
jgi:hypothetical protein